MDRKKLDNLRRELEGMRGNPQKATDVASLVERLGRKREDRGKEPTWVSDDFELPNLTIPMHSGDLKRRTLNSILNQVEDDILAWEQKLDYDERYAEVLKIERKKRGLDQ
jgi:hypothetical protein